MMNIKTTLANVICFFFLALNSIMATDDPCTATAITVNTTCTTSSFSNATATNTVGIPDPTCGGYEGGDVWFTFTMPNYGYHTVVELSAGTMTDGGMAVYSGTDCSNLTFVECNDNDGVGNMPLITVEDGCGFEFAGATFWVRVWENGNDNNGTFDICAYTTATDVPSGVAACGSNLISGNTCCDALLLGEELDGYCGSTTGYNNVGGEITGLCALLDNDTWVAFIASETSIDISFTTSNCTSGIQAAILETDDCINFTTVSNCFGDSLTLSGNLVATGLTVGETYYIMIDGYLGDDCDYSFGVVSGVETVLTSVDDEDICQGESTQLHANVIGAGNYTYNWSPAGSLDDATSPNPIATPTTTTDYTVTITGVTDNIHTLSVTVYPSAPTIPIISGTTPTCENSTGAIYAATSTNASTYNWTVTGGATISGGNGMDTLIVDWGGTGGDICVTAENNCGISAQECITIATTSQPDITATDPDPICSPDFFDLNTIVFTNTGGSSGSVSITYYDNLTDANNGTNDIFPPLVNVSDTYYIRMATGPDCYDVDSANVVIQEPELVVVNPGSKCTPDFIDLSAVSITEVNGFPGGTKTYFADSLDAVNNTAVLSSTQVYTAGTYWVRYETPANCFVVAPITVVIDMTPDVIINQPPPLCPGGSIDLDTISFTEATGVTFVRRYFNNYFFADSGFADLLNTVVSMPGTYYMRAQTANNCYQVVEIIITAGMIPEGEIAGGGTFCAGQSADIVFTLNGSGPFDVIYSDGTTNFTLNNISDNHTETITVTQDVTYTLLSVMDANGCNGNLMGNPLDFTANPAPTGTISGDASMCGTGMVDIDFTFTGNGPFDAVYSDGTDDFTLTNVPSSHTVTLNVTESTTFTLVSLTDGGSCPGTVSGSAAITIFEPLQTSNITETCDASFTMYTVSFEITGGDIATYNVSGGPGTLSGNIFTSDPIASGMAYNFTLSDASVCLDQTVSGSHNCSCATDAGQMDLTLIEVCEDETAIATFITGSNTLNSGDVFQYVLHDNAGGTLGNVIETSNIPEFDLQSGVNIGTTYYISAIAGPDNGSGEVDVNHICFSIAQGTPVVFYELPQATISGDATICQGDCVDLTINFPEGTGPFNVIVSDGTNTTSLDNISDGYQHNVCPTVLTTYTLTFVEDNTAAQCNGTTSGSATISVIDTIVISNIVETCDASFTTYTVSFEITGGDVATYNVTGDAGTLAGNIFTSAPIANGASYSFNVLDNSGCTGEIVTGNHDCVCTTDAGQMDLMPLNVCEDEIVTAVFMTGSNTLMTGDLFQYVLHENAGATLGNIIDVSNTPVFLYQTGIDIGTTYYISPMAGPDDGTGNVDVNHMCFSISEGTPITFFQLPTATISGDATICAGGTADLVFNFSTGTGPFDVSVLDGNTNTTFTIEDLNDGDTYAVTPSATTIYTIESVADNSLAGCIGSGTGMATLTVNNSPQVPAATIQVNCNDTNTQYQISFEITGGDAATYSVNGGLGTLSGNIFTSDFINNGTPYSFQVDDINACGPLEVSGNHVCDCTSNSGAMSSTKIDACEDETAMAEHLMADLNLDGNDVLGFILYDQGPSDVMLMNSTPEFDYDPLLVYGATYYIAAVVADDSGTGFPVLDANIDPCLSISNGQPVSFIQNPEVAISGDNTICQGDSTDIIFTFEGVGPFDVTYTDGTTDFNLSGIANGHSLRVAPNITTVYTLSTVALTASPFCDGVVDVNNTAVVINVIEVPVVSNVLSECNQLGTSYTISFEITGGNAGAYNVNGDPGTLNGNIFTSDLMLSGSTYNFQVDDGSGCMPIVLTATEYCNCTPDIKPAITIDLTVSCYGESDGAVSAVNENGQAPFSFAWSNGTVGEMTDNLASGWHYVTMTDGNNCESVDSIFLDEPESIQSEMIATVPSCFGENDAEVTFENTEGGTGVYTYSIDYYTSYTVNSFYNLPAGIYEGTVVDSDGCTWIDTIEITNPEEFVLDLGEDVSLDLGDSLMINPFASLPVDTFTWRPGTFLDCMDCWEQTIRPTESVAYTLTATTAEGCSATDAILIEVSKQRRVFVPTAFSPNGDGDNDIFKVYAGSDVEAILEFKVFDRWGALVYETQNVTPEMENFGWDGTLKGKDMRQGVFIYFVEVLFKDGQSEVIKGDVTLLK